MTLCRMVDPPVGYDGDTHGYLWIRTGGAVPGAQSMCLYRSLTSGVVEGWYHWRFEEQADDTH